MNKRKQIEDAKIAASAKIAKEVKSSGTPYISDEVYGNLPELLKECVEVFEEKRERDVFLTGALGVLSGCISNVTGTYDGREYHPNLYTYISAPAASGKGILAYTRCLGSLYHEYIKSQQVVEDRSQQVLFIPGNISSSAFMGHLQTTSNGIFFETEADTIGNTFKQEWGSISDLLRKGYHHETFSMSRKMNNEFIEIPSPRLSLVLSGTPAQIHGIISSAEDGLFSRMTFYTYSGGDSKWKDVSPGAVKIDYKSHFSAIGEQLFTIFRGLHEGANIKFDWSKDQWELFNDEQESFQDKVLEDYNEGAISLVRRSGLMWFRMSMILSVLRQYNDIDSSNTIECDDIDFLNSMNLMEIYKSHNLFMYGHLPSQATSQSVRNQKEAMFLNYLPEEFTKLEALSVGNEMKLSDRTISDRLSKAKAVGLVTSPKAGFYLKVLSS